MFGSFLCCSLFPLCWTGLATDACVHTFRTKRLTLLSLTFFGQLILGSFAFDHGN